MIRVIRVEGGQVPSFLTQQAALRGYLKTDRFRRSAEVALWDRRGEYFADGMRFDETTRADFLAGQFDFAAELPVRRGKAEDRVEWAATLADFSERWTALSVKVESIVGPDLDDEIPELSNADLTAFKSWVYPIEVAYANATEWWMLGLAGTDEQILLYKGTAMQYARHGDGWQIPAIGKLTRVKSAKEYPFPDTKVRQVYTWLSPTEHALAIPGEKLFRREMVNED